MEEWFFLDRIVIGGTNLVVNKRIEYTPDIFSNAAMTEFAIGNTTAKIAKPALDLTVGFRLPKNRLFQNISL